MQLIDLIIIVTIIICLSLFAFAIVNNKKLIKGGEFIKSNLYYEGKNTKNRVIVEEEATPTISQIRFDNMPIIKKRQIFKYISGNESLEKRVDLYFKDLLKFTSEDLKRRFDFKFNGYEGKFLNSTEAHYMSDGHIDLLGTLLLLNNPKNVNMGFSVCEWHGDEFRSESNEYFTEYIADKSLKLEKSKYIDKNEEPFKSLLERAYENELKIYIEFSYNQHLRSDIGYSVVHEFAPKIITRIINNLSKDANGLNLYVIRIIVNYVYHVKLSEVDKKLGLMPIIDPYEIEFEETIISDKNRKVIRLNMFDETDYSVVNIPSTKEQFSYDEELMLEVSINQKIWRIDIQIEHSENLSNHKSNLVEFISRNLSSKTDEANLRLAFESTNYLNKGEEKFKVNLMKNADLTSSIIVNSFGSFKDKFF